MFILIALLFLFVTGVIVALGLFVTMLPYLLIGFATFGVVWLMIQVFK